LRRDSNSIVDYNISENHRSENKKAGEKIMRKSSIYALILIVVVMIILILIVLNFSKSPVLVGVLGTYSGKNSLLGIPVRNGILMAFDELNAEGGINGRGIELIIIDDENNPDKIKYATNKLIEQGVVAILGPVSSGMTAGAIDIANENKVLLFGPTVASSLFSGLDDYFIRNMSTSKKIGTKLSGYLKENTDFEKILAIYDENNKEYSLDILNDFETDFADDNAKIIGKVPFDSKNVDFDDLVDKVEEYKPDAIFFIASAADTAFFAQNLRTSGLDTQIIASAWAKQNELIESGGRAVDGMIITSNYRDNIQTHEFLEFEKKYEEKYGEVPNTRALYGYECASIVIEILKANPNLTSENIKNAILEKGSFKGLLGDIEFDEYGDVERGTYIAVIDNGEFQTVE
jgi:branched-chain amino acid transport system substrate-binding protein